MTVAVPISPKNAAPNTSPGVVTGKVAGSGVDEDPLTYSVNPTTAKGGTVTVNGGGAFTCTLSAPARHNAAASKATVADKTDSWSSTPTASSPTPAAAARYMAAVFTGPLADKVDTFWAVPGDRMGQRRTGTEHLTGRTNSTPLR